MEDTWITIVQNSGMVTSIIFSLGFILVLCVKPLREKLKEYIILKHDEDQQLAKIKELEEIVNQQTIEIKGLREDIINLSNQLAACKALLAVQQQMIDQDN